jgi:hypothetical protein
MGLAVSVFALADLLKHDPEGAAWLRGQLERVNAVLEAEGLGTVLEPETRPANLERHAAGSVPYGFLQRLRRAYTRARRGLPVTPVEGKLSPEDEDIVMDEGTLFDSHVLCHSDAEGFYVPLVFSHPIFSDAVPGGMLGSSQALLRELLFVAPALGVALDANGAPTLEALNGLSDVPEDDPFLRERVVWFALFEAAIISVQHGTVIVFN